jgi:hypothetical protein
MAAGGITALIPCGNTTYSMMSPTTLTPDVNPYRKRCAPDLSSRQRNGSCSSRPPSCTRRFHRPAPALRDYESDPPAVTSNGMPVSRSDGPTRRSPGSSVCVWRVPAPMRRTCSRRRRGAAGRSGC